VRGAGAGRDQARQQQERHQPADRVKQPAMADRIAGDDVSGEEDPIEWDEGSGVGRPCDPEVLLPVRKRVVDLDRMKPAIEPDRRAAERAVAAGDRASVDLQDRRLAARDEPIQRRFGDGDVPAPAHAEVRDRELGGAHP
jgi:hypothetical protein